MEKSTSIGTIAGLKLLIKPSAVIASLLIWIMLALVGKKGLKLKLGTAVAGGFIGMIIHVFSELWHQVGHARAARQTGYPMSGVLLWGPLATSLYPEDEPVLAPDIHIQRALGGPIFSGLLTLTTGILAAILFPMRNLFSFIAAFAFLDNLFVYTLGAFLPLGFTDGSTILHWWRVKKERASHWVRVTE